MKSKLMSYTEAVEHLKDLVRVFAQNIEQKNTLLQKGVNPKDIDRELERILNEIESVTGERSIQHAKLVIAQFEGES